MIRGVWERSNRSGRIASGFAGRGSVRTAPNAARAAIAKLFNFSSSHSSIHQFGQKQSPFLLNPAFRQWGREEAGRGASAHGSRLVGAAGRSKLLPASRIGCSNGPLRRSAFAGTSGGNPAGGDPIVWRQTIRALMEERARCPRESRTLFQLRFWPGPWPGLRGQFQHFAGEGDQGHLRVGRLV